MKKQSGFTLLELMVVVMIIAILAALAISSYSKQVRKSRRSDAKNVMSDYALREEKWRSNHATYGTLADINGDTNSPAKYYTIAITNPSSGTCAGGAAKSSANAFIITATAVGDQAKDTTCAAMVLNSECGLAPQKSPTDCW